MMFTPPRRSTDSFSRLSSWTISPSSSHVTVCRPIWGWGATSIAAPSVNVSGPNRSRKHQGPIIRRPFTGKARYTTSDPSETSRAGCASNRCCGAPRATHASAATVESAMSRLRFGISVSGLRIDEVPDHGIVVHVAADLLLDRAVGPGQSLMLTQVFRPGGDQKRFDIAIGLFHVTEDAPARRAVPAPHAS